MGAEPSAASNQIYRQRLKPQQFGPRRKLAAPLAESFLAMDSPMPVASTDSTSLTLSLSATAPRPHLSPITSSPDGAVRAILDAVLPPKRVEVGGVAMLQRASAEPATRAMTAELRNLLEARLVSRGARPEGLCAVRAAVHDALWDELVRQEVIACPERGVFAAALRDEQRLSRAVYDHLASAAGRQAAARRRLLADETALREAELAEVTAANALREAEAAGLRAQLATNSQRDAERRAAEAKRRGEDLAYHRRAAAQAVAETKRIGAANR